MKLETYLELVEGKKGQFIKLSWERRMRTRADRDEMVTKKTVVTARTGLTYDNIKTVIEDRQNGLLPKKNAGLQWGIWHTHPWTIKHEGVYYARVYNASNASPEVNYFLNGNEISKEYACQFLTPSDRQEELNRKSCWRCFTVKMDDLIEL